MATTLPKPGRKSRTIRSRPRLEPLEDRLAPAILEVVGSGGNGTTTFDTFDQADNASTSSDVIQLEPSAGDVGSIMLQPNKAQTVQGDPNFAVGSASEAVDNCTGLGNFFHLWVNGTLSVNSINGSHLSATSSGGAILLQDDEIAGSVTVGGFFIITPFQLPGGDRILNCDFKPGARLQIQEAVNELVSGCTFEPSPTTSLVIKSAAVIVKDCAVSVTTATDAVQITTFPLGGHFGSRVDFEHDDIQSQNGTGIDVSQTGIQLSAEGTLFQGTKTAISLNGALVAGVIGGGVGGYVDLGGGGHSLGGNEFVVNVTTAVSLVNSDSTLPVSVNDDVMGPGVTPVAGAAAGEPVNQGMNLTPSQAFVEGLYHVYLLHTPTLNELNSWVNRLPSLGNSGVSQLIAHSQEAVTRIVDSLYQQLLGRSADAGGEAAFVGFLGNGGTEEQAIEGMLGSAEFAARANGLAGTPGSSANLNFVRSLYAVLLGRSNETAAEDNAWLNALGAGGKVAVVAGFVQGPEFRGDYVTSLYTSYTSLPGDSFFGAVPNLLCRPVPPAPSEVASWVNSGLNMQQIAVFMSASSEFFSDR